MTHQFQIESMKSIEANFKEVSGLPDRRHFKIFYSPVFRAELLVLGLQPRGQPSDFSADGMHDFARNLPSAASAGFYDKGENDILDCDWSFARGMSALIASGLFSDRSSFRSNAVVSNLSFVRREKVKKAEIMSDIAMSREGIAKILRAVRPKAIITTFDFQKYPIHGLTGQSVASCAKAPGVGQLILQVGAALLDGMPVSLYGVAHPSQFSWIYATFGVGRTIRQKMNAA